MFKVTSEMLRVIKGSVKILTAAVESITSVTRLTDALSLDALSIVMAFFTFTGWGLFTWHRNVQYLIRTGPTDKNVFAFIVFLNLFDLLFTPILRDKCSFNCFDIRENYPIRYAQKLIYDFLKNMYRESRTCINLQYNTMQLKNWREKCLLPANGNEVISPLI